MPIFKEVFFMAKLKKRADGRYQRKITLSDGRQKIVYGRTLAELAAAEAAQSDGGEDPAEDDATEE